MQISGATALVTGANRGFGRAVAAELLARGAHVYAGARRPETVDLADARALAVDITDPDSIAAAAAAAHDVTILVNSAGSPPGADLLAGDLDAIRAEFDTHVFGTLAMTRAFAPVIEANGGGAVLNVLSVLSWYSVPDKGAYGAAKAAAWSMTNALRISLAPRGVWLGALHVGFIDTDMAAHETDPKLPAAEVARVAVDGIEANLAEILVDDVSRNVQAGLAGGVRALYPWFWASSELR
ncbi:MAG TPA: SDR family oxidoreductase [Sporichthya sp.]|nr:SDR family oxidoreductase [Sporichthya sp.]